MKAQLAADARRLEEIPNIGPALADDLRAIGIKGPVDLKGKDGLKLYDQLNKTTGRRHDPCVADTFLAAVDFMNGGAPRPWWTFTADRKKLLGAGLLVCLFAAGCAGPLKVNSVVNPDYSGKKYSSVLVVANGRNVEFQKQLELMVTMLLKEKMPDTIFIAAHQQVSPPFSRKKLNDVASKQNLEGRLVLIATKPQFKGADRTVEDIANGLTGTSPVEMLGVEATLIDVKTNIKVWMALISAPAREGKEGSQFVLLAEAIAAKVLSAGILASKSSE